MNAIQSTDKPVIPSHIAQKLVTPSAYASSEIHEAYSWLRENAPLAVASPVGFDPFWVVTKHEDILHISRNNDIFPSGARATVLGPKDHIDRVMHLTGGPNLVRTIIQMDGQDHRKYRNLTHSWFAPGSIRRRDNAISSLAEEAVQKLVKFGGNCDAVIDVGLEYPLRVVMDILGVPDEEMPRMLKLTQELFGPQDPDNQRQDIDSCDQSYSASVRSAVSDFNEFFNNISIDRRENPRDDLATLIANAEINGEPIGEIEAASYYMIVASAGHDTTSYSLATGMWALATVPGLFRQLKERAELIPQFIEEVIRWTSPVKTFMRSAREDVELRGQKIASGDWIALCYASGNRDEEIFDRPFEFDINRKPNAQLSFGYGAHNCVGQHLARLELRRFFDVILRRLESIELDGEPQLTQSWFVNGFKSLPIRYVVA